MYVNQKKLRMNKINLWRLLTILLTSSLLVLTTTNPIKAGQSEYLASKSSDSTNLVDVFQAEHSGENLITMRAENLKLSQFLSQIADQVNVGLSYDSTIALDQTISGEFVAKPLNEVMLRLLNKNGLTYTISEDGNVLVVKRIDEIFSPNEWQETLTGRVVDAQTGEPLPGVNILVKGTTRGTSTDVNGEFSFNVDDLNIVLVVTYIGYEQKEIEVSGSEQIEVQLQLSVVEGEELVVIGYGQQRQRDLTGAVSSINTKDIQNQTVTSAEQFLQGKIPGVQLTNSSGQPGSATNILIRGGSSINAGNLPLFVVDGVPINMSTDETSAGILNGVPISPLASINPDDIQSISVLKDASATAIYGARGAGGVVLLTTKRGVSGNAQVSYRGSLGIQTSPENYPVLNATEYAQLRNEALKNDGLPPIYTEQEINSFGEGTNWQDEIFRTGNAQKHYISLGGGNETTQYFVSAGYNFMNGAIIESDFENINLRLNLNADITEKIRIGNNFTASRINSNIIKSSENTGGSGADVILAALIFNPTTAVRADDGTYNLINEPGGQPNPVATAREITNQNERYNYVNNFFGEFDISNGLTFRSDLGININNSKENYFTPDYIQIVTPLNQATVGSLNNTNWVFNNILRFEKQFEAFGNIPQNIDVTLGFTRENTSRELLQAGALGFPVNELGFHNLSSGEQFSTPGTFEDSSDLISYLGRVNYRLLDRYLFTVSGRVDGSSRFGKGNKYGFFPSGAFAWNMADESFIEDLDMFSELKLRLSYGITGNQEIGNYQSLSLMSTSTIVLSERVQNAVFPLNISNPDLKWETTGQFNVGLDIRTLNDKLSFSADYYNKKTSDLLLNSPLPFTSGFGQSTINLGDIRNKGFEFGIQANSLRSGNEYGI